MEEIVSTSEEFKPCVSYNAYEVSLDGRVRVRASKKLVKIVTLNMVNYVVIKIGMYSGKGEFKNKAIKRKTIKVSEMIARTYLKKKKDDLLRCINGDWNDYSLTNYEWYNPRELTENKIGNIHRRLYCIFCRHFLYTAVQTDRKTSLTLYGSYP